ncbi:MAG: MFS transporter [Chromatiales bacterium]|nr:MFS transporter [Chromatiales bacterium]
MISDRLTGGEDRRGRWGEVWYAWTRPQTIAMLFLGFAAGLPILLIFSSLSLWLREAGVDRAAVTYFSWAALAYSFKFVWAPLVDKLPLPVLTNMLGRRRAWLLLAQLMVITAICWMALINPADSEQALTVMALAAVLLGFSSATQDIVIDAYRIEIVEAKLQAMLSAAYTAGYRIGMVVAGAGALFLAQALGSTSDTYEYQAWMWTYLTMAGVMGVGVITTLLIREPEGKPGESRYLHKTSDYLRFLLLFALMVVGLISSYSITQPVTEALQEALSGGIFAAFIANVLHLLLAIVGALFTGYLSSLFGVTRREILGETYISPVLEFFNRYGLRIALFLLLLVGFYRVSDIVLGVIANLFYQDMGFSKNEIAAVTKTFGLLMSIVGSFLGGMLTIRFGVIAILFVGALLSAATNLLFLLLASSGHDIVLLTIVIAADNISGGLAVAAFIAFLSSLTNISFTAMQYAIFSSLMTLFPKLLGGYSGSMVEAIDYEGFFILTTLMGLPVLLLVWYAGRLLKQDEPTDAD